MYRLDAGAYLVWHLARTGAVDTATVRMSSQCANDQLGIIGKSTGYGSDVDGAAGDK